MTINRHIVPILFLFLSACAGTLRGTPGIVDSNGVVGVSPDAYTITAQNRDFRQQFANDFRDARANPGDDILRARMMRSGELLVRVNCNDFFANAAILQRDSQISRDLVAPIFSILSGIVSLRTLSSDESSDLSQIFSMSNSAITTGISLVDAHFLFGAGNIDEVRELTFKALDADEEGLSRAGTPTFEDGVAQLVDHQIICTPAHILRRTREAIQAGTVEANVSIAQAEDQAALRALGTALHLTGPATNDQALALWALYRNGYPAGDALPDKLMTRLTALHLGTLVTDKKLNRLGTEQAENINNALDRFSPSAQAQLRRNAHNYDVSTAALDQLLTSREFSALTTDDDRIRSRRAAEDEDQRETDRRFALIQNFTLSSAGVHPRVRLSVH